MEQYFNKLQPGDKLTMAFTKNAKPAWLETQKEQGNGSGTQPDQMAGGDPGNMPPRPPASAAPPMPLDVGPGLSSAPDPHMERMMLMRGLRQRFGGM